MTCIAKFVLYMHGIYTAVLTQIQLHILTLLHCKHLLYFMSIIGN